MPRRMLLLVATGELLAMTLWFSATAASPAIASDLGMDSGRIAWLTMAVQFGFVVGTLTSALLNLPDAINPRRLFALGCLAGAIANGAITLAGTPALVVSLRFATGVALALVYPPGMKIVAGWFRAGRGTALGIMIGALTVGSSFPHLLAWLAAGVSWRALVLTSSALALLGGTIVSLLVRDGPYVSASAPFDLHGAAQVVGNRCVRLATLGYLGHMWELYAMWTWLPAFVTASLHAAGAPAGTRGSLAAFVAIVAGGAGCAAAGRTADAWGAARIATSAMAASAACGVLTPVVFGAPPAWLWMLTVVWGVAVVADSPEFSTLVTEYSPRTLVGTALTLQTCLGFLLTMVTLRVVPAIAGWIGWRWAFLVLVPGPVLGALAMSRLGRGAATASSGTLRTQASPGRSKGSASCPPSAATGA